MAFKKAKPTFGSQAGRNGMPKAMKPFAAKTTKATAKKSATAMSKNTAKATKKVVKNGAPLKTKKVTPNRNAKTGKGFSLFGSIARDSKFSNFFMGKKSKPAKSATKSPQSAPQAYKPRG